MTATTTPTTKTVYVVIFEPSLNADGSTYHGVGGFDWYAARHLAVRRVIEHLEEPRFDIQFKEVAVDTRLTDDEITELLEQEY